VLHFTFESALNGRFAGFGVGVILGVWDISKSIEARQSGDSGLSNAYFLSGGAAIGISAAMLLAGSLGPWGWAIMAIGFLVWLGATYFIETHTDNPVQEWLARCHFGHSADRYPDQTTQAKEYGLAIGN
jgi:hypothetical protein